MSVTPSTHAVDLDDLASRRWSLWEIVFPVLLVLLVVIVYVRTLEYGFHFDDYVLARPWRWDDLRAAFHGQFDPTGINDAYFRPLISVSFAVDWWLWGTNAVGYHVTNLVLHLAVVLSAYALFSRLSSPLPAAIGSAYFAIVPSNAVTLVYVAERTDSISVLFVVLGLLAVFGYWRSGRVRYVVALNACLAISLSAKEIGIALVLLAPILWLHLGVTENGAPVDRSPSLWAHWRSEFGLMRRSLLSPARRRSWVVLVVPMLVVGVIYLLIRQWALPPGSLGGRFAETQSPPRALLGGIRSTIEGVPWELSGGPFVPLLIGLALVFVLRPRSAAWRLGVTGVLSMIALVAPLSFSGGVEPRLLYGAQLGLAMVVAAAADIVANSVREGQWAKGRAALVACIGLATIGVVVTAGRAVVDTQDLYRPGSEFKLDFDQRLWDRPEQIALMPPEYVDEIGQRLYEAGRIDSPEPP